MTRRIVVVVLVILAMLGMLRMAGNELTRGDVPVACQIFGGSWDVWNGYQCGG